MTTCMLCGAEMPEPDTEGRPQDYYLFSLLAPLVDLLFAAMERTAVELDPGLEMVIPQKEPPRSGTEEMRQYQMKAAAN